MSNENSDELLAQAKLLINDRKFSDCSFLVGVDVKESFFCHKLMLSMGKFFKFKF